MRFTPQPTFPTRPWRNVWSNNPQKLRAIRHKTRDRPIIAIECEPWHESPGVASSIGIAYLRPMDDNQMDEYMDTMESVYASDFWELHHQFHIHTRHIIVENRPQPATRTAHRATFGSPTYVPAAGLEAAVIQQIQHLLQTDGNDFAVQHKTKKRPLLIGFDMTADFQILAAECPHLLSYFSAWTDVSDLTRPLDKLQITNLGMRALLTRLAYRDSTVLSSKVSGVPFHAARNALRTMTALIVILALEHERLLLLQTQPRSPMQLELANEYTIRRAQFHKSCKRFSLKTHPYAVKVVLDIRQSLPDQDTHDADDQQSLMGYTRRCFFEAFRGKLISGVSAIAIHHQKTCAWVYFSWAQQAGEFAFEANGTEGFTASSFHGGVKKGVWRAEVSDKFTPKPTQDMTAFYDFNEREQKQQERRAKRLLNVYDDWSYRGIRLLMTDHENTDTTALQLDDEWLIETPSEDELISDAEREKQGGPKERWALRDSLELAFAILLVLWLVGPCQKCA